MNSDEMRCVVRWDRGRSEGVVMKKGVSRAGEREVVGR